MAAPAADDPIRPRRGRASPPSSTSRCSLAIVLGALVGHFWPEWGEALKPLGDGFIKLVKMIIAPVIFLTVVLGIAGMSEIARGRPGRGQGVRLFPVLLDAGADRRADRRQCRPARARA